MDSLLGYALLVARHHTRSDLVVTRHDILQSDTGLPIGQTIATNEDLLLGDVRS